jgi:acetolactate synthase small subunit
MANVASLTSRRGGNHVAVARLIAKISDIVNDAAMDRDRKIHELNKKLGDLHDKIKVVETLDTEIVELLAAADVQAEMDIAGVINTTA